MENSKIKIVVDSSADAIELSGVDFAFAPLKIVTSEKEYVDDEKLDVSEMVCDLYSYKGKSSTSCPNANDWMNAFGDAEKVICITITGTLSGAHNSAMLAKKLYEAEDPARKVFVWDSLSTGPEMMLLIEKVKDFILAGKEFDDICDKLTRYSKRTGLIFMLESLANLANNGRVNPLVAKVAGVLGIRVVGRASDKGDLEQLNKCRGEKKALECIVSHLKEFGFKGGRVRISHCCNESAAKVLKNMIENEFSGAQVNYYEARGLCSFYAEKGGLLLGFEKRVTPI